MAARYRRVHAGGADGGAVRGRVPSGPDADLRGAEDAAGGHRPVGGGHLALPALPVPRRPADLHRHGRPRHLPQDGESGLHPVHRLGRLPLDPRSHL